MLQSGQQITISKLQDKILYCGYNLYHVSNKTDNDYYGIHNPLTFINILIRNNIASVKFVGYEVHDVGSYVTGMVIDSSKVKYVEYN